jgi:hypothetical protein
MYVLARAIAKVTVAQISECMISKRNDVLTIELSKVTLPS